MNYQEMKAAVEDAKRTKRTFESQCEALARLLCGSLRQVTRDNLWSQHNILCALKKELTQYDARERKWKS